MSYSYLCGDKYHFPYLLCGEVNIDRYLYLSGGKFHFILIYIYAELNILHKFDVEKLFESKSDHNI